MLHYYALLLGFLALSLQGKSLDDYMVAGVLLVAVRDTCILQKETLCAEPQWEIRVDLYISILYNTPRRSLNMWYGLRDFSVSCASGAATFYFTVFKHTFYFTDIFSRINNDQ